MSTDPQNGDTIDEDESLTSSTDTRWTYLGSTLSVLIIVVFLIMVGAIAGLDENKTYTVRLEPYTEHTSASKDTTVYLDTVGEVSETNSSGEVLTSYDGVNRTDITS